MSVSYPVNCAGCMVRKVFHKVERLAQWAQRHRCWEQKPDERPTFKTHADTFGYPDPDWAKS